MKRKIPSTKPKIPPTDSPEYRRLLCVFKRYYRQSAKDFVELLSRLAIG